MEVFLPPSFSRNPGSSPNNNDADQTINVSSHEQMEAATDPLLNAWYDSSGNEIGDKCAWQFGPLDPAGGDVVWNGHEYIVQQEWDNNTGSCRLTASTGLHSLPGTWAQCASENGTCSFSSNLEVAGLPTPDRFWMPLEEYYFQRMMKLEREANVLESSPGWQQTPTIHGWCSY